MATSSLTNTGNQPYTQARIDYLASYMQTQLPGLSHEAAVKWIKAEQGVHGNVLGVTYRDASGQHLYQYSSQEAGIRAAVALIKSSNNYTGIRASLGQSVTAQLQAIAASPWNAPSHYRNGGTFGVSISGATKSVTSAIQPATAKLVSDAQGGATAPASLVWGVPDGKVLTNADVETILSSMVAAKLLPDMGSSNGLPFQVTNTVRTILKAEVGQPWNTATRERVQAKLGTEAAAQPTDVGKALQGIGNAITPQALKDAARVAGDLGAFLFDRENWKYIGALVIGVPLALFGFYLLAGVKTGGTELA